MRSMPANIHNAESPLGRVISHAGQRRNVTNRCSDAQPAALNVGTYAMFTTSLILLLAMALPTAVVIAGLLVWRARHRSDKRRSPLMDKILNLPGEQLRKQIAKHEDTYCEATALIIALGSIFLSAWLLSRMTGMDWSRTQFGWNDLLMAAAALGVLGWCLWRLGSHATQAR